MQRLGLADLGRAAGGDAEAVGGGLGGAEGPAAAAVGLVADVADDLRALRELPEPGTAVLDR